MYRPFRANWSCLQICQNPEGSDSEDSMGRTLPSITQVFYHEQEALVRFRRALRRGDQLALDELMDSAHKHLAAASYAAHALPFEVFLLAMLLEEHKQVQRLQATLEAHQSPHD
jgi:hypothetical protein